MAPAATRRGRTTWRPPWRSPVGWWPTAPISWTWAGNPRGRVTRSVDAAEELRRVVPVLEAVRAAHPEVPLSVDTTKPSVAAAAIDAGAGLINDVWGVAEDDALIRLAAERGMPIVLMHNRAEARYTNLMAEIVAELERAIERAIRAGCRFEDLLVDPGFGFGKTPQHNLVLLRELETLRVLGRPILLGHVAQVHPGPGARPATRRASRGDPGHDRPGDRRRSRHRPGPRRAGQSSGSPG